MSLRVTKSLGDIGFFLTPSSTLRILGWTYPLIFGSQHFMLSDLGEVSVGGTSG